MQPAAEFRPAAAAVGPPAKTVRGGLRRIVVEVQTLIDGVTVGGAKSALDQRTSTSCTHWACDASGPGGHNEI